MLTEIWTKTSHTPITIRQKLPNICLGWRLPSFDFFELYTKNKYPIPATKNPQNLNYTAYTTIKVQENNPSPTKYKTNLIIKTDAKEVPECLIKFLTNQKFK